MTPPAGLVSLFPDTAYLRESLHAQMTTTRPTRAPNTEGNQKTWQGWDAHLAAAGRA